MASSRDVSVPEWDTVDATTPEFLEALLASTDPALLDAIARKGAVAWAVTRSVTLLTCYRQKQLFETLETRKEAVDKTGHTSWSAWLASVNLPVSDGLVRQRCIEITGYLSQGLDWMTILSILSYGPTAGSEVLQNVVGPDGTPAPHIDVSKLPGGTVAGLLEAIAAIEDSGQARRLVSEVAGQVQVYATDALLNEGRMYITIRYEHPQVDESLYVTVTCHTEGGRLRQLPDNVAHWLARKIGARML